VPVKTARTVEDVLTHHIQAFQSANVDMILEDYAPEAVIIGPENVARGPGEIRKMYERNFKLFPVGSDIRITKTEVTDKLAYIIWSAESPVVNVSFGTDTFFIEKGMITSHSFAAQMTLKMDLGK
jgi:hypothetical protein